MTVEPSSKTPKGPSSKHAPSPETISSALSEFKIPFIAIGLFLLVLAVFGQAKNFTFLSYDDNQYILEIPAVREGLSWSSIVWAVMHSHVGQWHPLTSWSFILDSSISGLPQEIAAGKPLDSAGWFHLHNVLLHGAAGSLLFLALRQLTGSIWRSAFAAAIFAIHPLRAESVAWITERKDVLSGFFLMALLWAYGFYAQKTSSQKRYIMLCVLFALGLLSKPMLVTLPFVFLLLDIWPLKRLDIEPAVEGQWLPTWLQAWPLIREKAPLFIMAVASAIGAVYAVGTPFRPIPILPLIPRLSYIPVSYLNYFKQLFIPVNLSPHYPFVVEGPGFAKAAGCLAALLLITWLAWKWRKNHPTILVGWLWFLGTMLPVIGLVPGGIQIAADRYTYFPQIGLGVAIAWVVGSLVTTQLQKQTAAIVGVTVIALLSAAAHQQGAIWRDDESLWTHSLKVTENNDYSSEKLASAYQARALREPPEKAQELRKEAERLFRDAVRLNPHLVGSLNNLSVLLRGKGELTEAIELQRKAAQEHPTWGLMHRNLASVLTQNKNYKEAAESFEKALSLDPNDVESHYNLALILSETQPDPQSQQKSLDHFIKAVNLQPRFAEAHFSIGNLLYRHGKVDDAILSFRRAIESDPRHARACNNLASLLGTKGEKEEPIRLYTQAVNVDPNYIEAYRNLAEALLKAGNAASAVQVWKTGLEKVPNDLPSLYRLSWIMATHPDSAVRRTFEPIDLAKRGLELTQEKEPAFWDALGAAYAQSGKFPEAREAVSKAIDLLPQGKTSPQADTLRARLALYEKEEPFRETPTAPPGQ